MLSRLRSRLLKHFRSNGAGDGELLSALRLLFGSAMIVAIVLGFAAIRQRQVIPHSAWMMRGYAIGLGVGTQTLTLAVGALLLGPPNEISRAFLMGAAWVINLINPALPRYVHCKAVGQAVGLMFWLRWNRLVGS